MRPLHDRVTEHRNKFYKLLNDLSFRLSNDYHSDANKGLYSLGEHLIDDHNLTSRTDFDISYDIFILKNSSPTSLEVNEHKFIQKLRTLKPLSINSWDPFRMPLLFENKAFTPGI